MKTFSQCCIFMMLMTCLATLFGTAIGVYELSAQPDLFSDILKISGLLAITSACVSYVFWRLTHLQKDSVFRGGLAGLLTGLAIVQVPYFTSTLKTEFFRIYNTEDIGVLMAALSALPLSLKRGLETFQIISKVSLVAVISSVILGIIIAKRVPPRPNQTLLPPQSTELG